MEKKTNNRAFLCIVLAVVMMLCCGCVQGPDETEPKTEVLTIPEASAVGGYEIRTEAMTCSVVVDGENKYSCFQSADGGLTVEFFASPTEMTIISTTNGKTQYYTEQHEDNGQTYPNPLQGVYDGLRELEFHYMETGSYYVYEAVRSVQSVSAEQIAYNVYSIDMEWIDGESYAYRYFVYEDGSTLISAEAPYEINPLLDAETPWRMDLENQTVYNTATGEKVAFTVKGVAAGEGLSPNGGNTTVVENHIRIQAHVNTETEQIEKLTYWQNEAGTEVTILYAADISKPEITQDMTLMDSETLQAAMMLVYMIESLI